MVRHYKPGESWDDVDCQTCISRRPPVCPWCDEAILPGERVTDERAVMFAEGVEWRPWHWECAARAALGSVGHQKKECSCYGGADEGDPPGASRREAARAAYLYALLQLPRGCDA